MVQYFTILHSFRDLYIFLALAKYDEEQQTCLTWQMAFIHVKKKKKWDETHQTEVTRDVLENWGRGYHLCL